MCRCSGITRSGPHHRLKVDSGRLHRRHVENFFLNLDVKAVQPTGRLHFKAHVLRFMANLLQFSTQSISPSRRRRSSSRRFILTHPLRHLFGRLLQLKLPWLAILDFLHHLFNKADLQGLKVLMM
jgi:hypothetical protein